MTVVTSLQRAAVVKLKFSRDLLSLDIMNSAWEFSVTTKLKQKK